LFETNTKQIKIRIIYLK